MSDLAKRLINDAATLVRDWDITRELEREAADEIERLRAALKRIAEETAATWVCDVARAALEDE